jgi:hypothetical protein
MKTIIKKVLYLSMVYFFLLCCYVVTQEMYVEQCTVRGGLFNLFVSMPVCVYMNRFLEMLSNQFISMFITFAGVILALTF